MNYIPKINFKRTNFHIKEIESFLKKSEEVVYTINYSNKDILMLYLKDIFINLNYIYGIDYSLISNKDYSKFKNQIISQINDENEKKQIDNFLLVQIFQYILEKNISLGSKEILIIDDENNDSELLNFLFNLNKNSNIKIIYLTKNLVNSNLNIPSTFDLNEEKDLRLYLEKNCNIDRKKLIRIITNYVYNEIESSNNKIEVINKYQLIFNDIENFLLMNLFNYKNINNSITNEKNPENVETNSITKVKELVEIKNNEINDNLKIIEEFETLEATKNKEFKENIDNKKEKKKKNDDDDISLSKNKKYIPIIFVILISIVSLISIIIL